MNRSLKVMFACALGAALGTFVALAVNSYFWWLGLPVGFIIGYLAYEFETVIAATKTVSRKTFGWRPDAELWKAYIKACLASWLVTLTYGFGLAIPTTLLITLLILLTTGGMGETSITQGVTENFLEVCDLFLGILMVWSLLCWLFGGIPAAIEMTILTMARDRSERLNDLEKARKDLLLWNPIRVYGYLVPKGIWWTAVRLPSGVKTTGRFAWLIFCEIHSDVRLLCGLDAAIGAACGYFAGSVLIGLISGGVMGLVNFEVVSKRVLKLVPKAH